jgi:murein DD-endopeptidase MepM/ murein hydrolase activator NlpD
MLKDILSQSEAFPIMGTVLTYENALHISLNAIKTELLHRISSNTSLLQIYIHEKIALSGKKYAYGGYLELRNWYQRSPLFGENRNIHLAIDIWCNELHPIYAPYDAVVHSKNNNEGFGNYGPTIILQHQLSGITFYTLFGHLSSADLDKLAVGQSLKVSELFAHVGNIEENGEWPTHLHFQVIADIQNFEGDYPGVCSVETLSFYKENCPDPNLILKIK